MALTAVLGNSNVTPNYVRTNAKVQIEKGESGWTITNIHLQCEAKIPSRTLRFASLRFV
jgi:osmotically inducible protein OsmC